jgi:hypothetical protein
MNPNEKLTIDVLPEINAPAPLDDFQITEPDPDEIQEAIESMDSFREHVRESRGDSLTFGDY